MQNQRERLLAALTELLAERGYEATTVSMIGKRAAVSKSDFYRQYESKDACFVAAYDGAVEEVREPVLAACGAADSWAEGMVEALRALLEGLAADPARTSLILVEGLRAGRGIYDRYQATLESFVVQLRDGAPTPPDGSRPPVATDEAVVGGVAALLSRRVIAGETERLPELLPEIAEFALTPYLGAAGARRIIPGDE